MNSREYVTKEVKVLREELKDLIAELGIDISRLKQIENRYFDLLDLKYDKKSDELLEDTFRRIVMLRQLATSVNKTEERGDQHGHE